VSKKKKTGPVLWSKDEVRLLKRLFPLGKARQIVEKTGRPLSAVRQKAYGMGIKTRDNRLWLASEMKIVKKLYPIKTARSIAERLDRSLEAVRARASSMGVRKAKSFGPPPWSKKEDALLKKLYPDEENTKPDMAKQIGRSVAAIAGRAIALGLRRRNTWSKKELRLVRKLYPTRTAEKTAEQIGRSVEATRTQVSRLGLRKNKRKT